MKNKCKVCKNEFVLRYKKKYCSKNCEDIDKRQFVLTTEEKQILLSGIFGDGTIFKNTSKYFNFKTSSIHKSYLQFKINYLTKLSCSNINKTENNGYKKSRIFSFTTQSHILLNEIKTNSIKTNLDNLTMLGIAIWFYDDGSYHKHKGFYNLNTHEFKEDIQRDLFIPFLKDRLDVNPTIAYDIKKSGKKFTYLRINKVSGNAENIKKLLRQFPVNCFSYKL